jgi:uncharacterized protein (DUF58 family)
MYCIVSQSRSSRKKMMNKKWYWACAGVMLVALLFRQPLILIVGVLALLVVITVHVWAIYCLTNLRFEHVLSEKRALFGAEVTLSITVENAKLLPLPWLEIEETVPRALNVRGRRLRIQPITNRSILESLFSTRWYERVTRRYTVVCSKRGIHTFGPTSLRSGDLFGFTERTETLENQQYLTVYPLILPLSSFNLPARHPFGDRRAPRRLLEDPSRVIGVRDYTYGDDLRRIHWKATARTLQLQSKVYEPTTTYTLALFLNISTQLNAYFNPSQELLELSVCATASITDWALHEGYAVGLYSNGFPYTPEYSTQLAETPDQAEHKSAISRLHKLKQQRVRLPPASSSEQHKRIMEALARVQSFFNSSIEEIIQSEHTRLPAGATIAVITATISDPLLDSLKRLRQAGHAVTILLVSDQALATRLAGIPVHHLGGTETWEKLSACYNHPEGEKQPAQETQKEMRVTAFHL